MTEDEKNTISYLRDELALAEGSLRIANSYLDWASAHIKTLEKEHERDLERIRLLEARISRVS